MKDDTGAVAIEEFVRFKSIMYLFLVYDGNSEDKKAKDMNRNGIEKITHNEYKDFLLNNKCLIDSMNRIQSKHHRIAAYEINKISLSCVRDKIYIQNNGYDGLAFGYQS